MKKIIIKNTKNIKRLEFPLPEKSGVYLIVGPNGAGKTTLLVCLERIANPYAFARGFSTSANFGEVDQYRNSEISYQLDNNTIVYRKRKSKWAVSPRKLSKCLEEFGYPDSVFIKADSKRIDISKEEIRKGNFEPADGIVKDELNTIFETDKFSKLERLKNNNGRGKKATYFYVIKESNNHYYSEKRFSTGELAILRLVEKLQEIKNNSLVLLDEAEMALHPRIQKNLLQYLNQIANEKDLTVFVATHSVTMIKVTNKLNIYALESVDNGEYSIVNPCYPAEAIGDVDFVGNVIPDYIFFVEDEMARIILKKELQIFCEKNNKYASMQYCVIPVGGYQQTLDLAIHTRKQLFNNSKVVVVWDQDVFDEPLQDDTQVKLKEKYKNNKNIIYSLNCTPEVWIIDELEKRDDIICQWIRETFNIEVNEILSSDEYRKCNSTKPRVLAKQKFEVVKKYLSEASGDSADVIINEIIDLFVSQPNNIGNIKRNIAPMLQE